MRHALILVIAGLVASCGKQVHKDGPTLRTFDVSEPPPAVQMPRMARSPVPGSEGDAAAQETSPAAPQIAYTYSMTYRLGARDVALVQQRHVALCDQLGPARCHVVAMAREADPVGSGQGTLTLVVEARLARAFQQRMDAAAAGAGGTLSSRGIEAEDLSKQIVDTAAKVRGKEALAQRLLALLSKRDGKVGELVEAERAYAEAQEELDAARSWLGAMNGRVAMSKVDVRYEGAAPAGNSAWQPVREALGGAGEVLGASAARLVTLLLAALPWALALALLVLLARRRGWRLRPQWPRLRRAPAASGFDCAGGAVPL